MNIECPFCGQEINLGHKYDNYAGEVKCIECGSLLQIQSENGEVLTVEPVKVMSENNDELEDFDDDEDLDEENLDDDYDDDDDDDYDFDDEEDYNFDEEEDLYDDEDDEDKK